VNDSSPQNPYEPSVSDTVSPTQGLTGAQAFLLGLVVVMLLVRGGFMAFSWFVQLSAGFDISSSFYTAIFIKDATYAVTAIVGGTLLIFSLRLGWWAAVIHWSWYIACEVLVVSTAEALDWTFPIRHGPPRLFTNMFVTAIFAIAAVGVLLWTPIMRRCGAKTDRRSFKLALLIAGCYTTALLLNGWSSLR
jgi:hypothetical protein